MVILKYEIQKFAYNEREVVYDGNKKRSEYLA